MKWFHSTYRKKLVALGRVIGPLSADVAGQVSSIDFTAVSDGLKWIIKQQGGSVYLDDYIMLGAPGKGECHSNLLKLAKFCKRMGVPAGPGKVRRAYHLLNISGYRGRHGADAVAPAKEKIKQSV